MPCRCNASLRNCFANSLTLGTAECSARTRSSVTFCHWPKVSQSISSEARWSTAIWFETWPQEKDREHSKKAKYVRQFIITYNQTKRIIKSCTLCVFSVECSCAWEHDFGNHQVCDIDTYIFDSIKFFLCLFCEMLKHFATHSLVLQVVIITC